jgi:hypothetical protein
LKQYVNYTIYSVKGVIAAESCECTFTLSKINHLKIIYHEQSSLYRSRCAGNPLGFWLFWNACWRHHTYTAGNCCYCHLIPHYKGRSGRLKVDQSVMPGFPLSQSA